MRAIELLAQQHPALRHLALLPLVAFCAALPGSASIACRQLKQPHHLASKGMMHATKLLAHHCTLLPVSGPPSAASMPADGTVQDSIVKQSANGGDVDVDNGDATCNAPGTVPTLDLCLAHVGAMIVLPLLYYQAGCCPC